MWFPSFWEGLYPFGATGSKSQASLSLGTTTYTFPVVSLVAGMGVVSALRAKLCSW